MYIYNILIIRHAKCCSISNIRPVQSTQFSPPPITASRSHSHLTIGRTPLDE